MREVELDNCTVLDDEMKAAVGDLETKNGTLIAVALQFEQLHSLYPALLALLALSASSRAMTRIRLGLCTSEEDFCAGYSVKLLSILLKLHIIVRTGLESRLCLILQNSISLD